MLRPRHPARAALLVLLLFSVPPAVFAAETPPAEPPAAVPLVDEKVRQLMQDGEYAEALKAIDAAAKPDKAPKDYLTYLKGRALFLQKKYDEAVATLKTVETDFPKSVWARRARFAGALALARKGDFRSAELIFRKEAEYLLSENRKQEIADVYLEFADAFFDPPEEEKKPDYQKALEFYQKALEVGPKAEKRAELELLVADCHRGLKKFSEAAALYEKFIENHAEGPLNLRARFHLGDCRLAEKKLKEARRAWEDLLAKHPDSRSDDIAETWYKLSRTWQVPKPSSDRELALGVAALEAFLERFPTRRLAGQAHLEIAQCYIHRGRYEDAVAGLGRFLADERHRDHKQIPDARNLLGRSYQLQKKFTEALATWREYLSKHPTHGEWSSVQREIINTEHLMAREKHQAEDYAEARKLWGEFVVKYPLDERNPSIFYTFGEMAYRQEKWEAAIADWRRLVSKYPKSEPSSRGQFMIAATMEQKLAQPAEALEEYKKVTWGNHAPKAKQAIARLTAKTMRLATERKFRSDETPKLKLTTRNIESVTVRAYRVDLETYFRKMHLARGVENLDVALIDPDATFEFEIPDYAKHRELESTVEVSLPGEATSGVMAVTVASKTLEATTLVIQSDLDVIVKSSRDEVFVFAQNMRTGKPWPEARLLISNGKEVFANDTTGPDGVFQQEYDELQEAGDARVFAISSGHVASNVLSLEGVGTSQGLSDRGYIYTDRPAYRAGQLVHVRGCIRRVPGSLARSMPPPPLDDVVPDGPGPAAPNSLRADTYTIEEGKEYDVQVFDGRNRLVWEEEVALSSFGTFHLHFVLPPTSPQGVYRVLAEDKDGRSFQGTFQGHQYKLEPVRLVVDTPRKVYYRGEEIEGTLRAGFYYGAPLAGREIRYQLADGRLHTAKTDEKGEVQFKLPTRDFQESQVLTLAVSLPERNLQTGVNFFLASQGFAVGVSTVRPVYVSGESFEVTVTANDAEGKPAARKLVLNVLEKTTVKGKVGERLVESHELETAEDDGTARQTLTLAEGGRYVLRAEGTDRFKNPIWGERLVTVSGEEDQVRLRILADRHTYKVGDTAKLRFHWREEPSLALVTFQGARVLDYRLVELKEGDNLLEIPISARLAPNFELAVAVMTDARGDGDDQPEDAKPPRRFHEASSPFIVERDLLVSLSTKRKGEGDAPVRPGEEIEVTVTTTDPQGRPVAAEVSLALVEQSLLERFAWPVEPIQAFFRGERRRPAVRTTSSVTFGYRPKTRAIDRQLLAERDRLEVATAEEASAVAVRESMADFDILAGLVEALPAPPMSESEARAVSGHVVTGEPAAEGADPFGRGEYGGRMNAYFDQAGQRPAVVGLDAARYAGAQVQGFARQRGGQARQLDRGVGGAWGIGGGTLGGGEQVALGDGAVRFRTEAVNAPAAGYGARVLGNELQLGTIAETLAFHDRRTADILQNRHDLVMLNAKGVAQNVNTEFLPGLDVLVLRGHERDVRKAADLIAQIEELADAGAVLLPGLGPQETGYWNPAVVTGDDGKATVTFAVPERSTAWTLMAKGITTETLAGEATDEVVVKKDLFGELKLPPAFTDGDKAEVIASVHNDAVTEGKIELVLKTTIGGRTVEETKTVDVTAKGIHEVAFKIALNRPEPNEEETDNPADEENVAFELTVTGPAGPDEAAGASDVVRRTVPLRPYGMPVFATASGSATSDTTAWVEQPKDMPLQAPSLQILVGPTVERSLLDVVLAPAPSCQIEAGRIASGLETTTSDLMASLSLQKLVGATREAGSPQAQSLDARIRSSISLLVSSQNDDGGWSWTGRGGASNRYSTARVVWAMSLARTAGYTVPDDAFQKAVGHLRDQLSKTTHSDYESQAILLHALSAAGSGDFAVANRLYRNRQAMSTAAVAHLVLAFLGMDRKATAEELLKLVGERDLDERTSRRLQEKGALPWSHSPAELRALYALALEEVSPRSAKAKEQVDWLLAHRTGHRWAPDKATGPAALALCRWFAQSRFDGEHYELAVFVNDVRVKLLDVDQATGTQVIDVPGKLLTEARHRINFQITGRGRYTYQCILGGFVPADKLKSTTADWAVRRTYEPAPLEMDGREIPRGFDVLQGSYSSFRNPLTELPVGRRGLVELYVYRHNVPSNTPEEQLEYLVITEPIPSGATVIENSVRGGFERFEISPGAITFYAGSRRHVGTIHYQLSGYLPGGYRAAPTQIRDAYRPDKLVVSPARPLRVLPSGGQSSDVYRLTPKELHELGKRHFAKGNLAEAQKHLTELVEKWNTKPEVYKEAVQTLLDVHLELGPPAKVVHYFEIVKEKWPQEEIPFAKIVKVGAAYHEMGEYERSYLVFRATVESSFQRESGVAGFLESQGEFVRSVDVMQRLLAEYPPEAYLASATYALAQRVYAKAPEAAADERLRREKVNRVDLIRQAWSMLESFLTAYPEDPAADQAAFSTANALLELEAYPKATLACNRYVERYPKSELLDSYWYIIGYCHFASGEHAKALEMCRKVAEARRIDKRTGRETESPNKHRAIYILGQVHHSLGQPADAIREYRRVADRFPDANEAIDYFIRKAIALDEVTTVKPGEAVEVDLEFRNIASCDVKVYRIDLMKFSLLKRNLGGITRINLAGIQPHHETTLKLGDGKDYRDRNRKIPLPLKDEGAYLVVCRGENLHTSGLVLLTPLVVEVQEDATSGRVRTTVKDTKSDSYLSDVHVKVIGSENTEFISGETDLRGVFVADGVHGESTVIAQAPPSHYAFFRGETPLAPAPPPPAPSQGAQQAEAAPSQPASAPQGGVQINQQLLRGLQETNESLQAPKVDQLQQMYQKGKAGVQASEAF